MPVKKNLKLNPKLDSTNEKTVTDTVVTDTVVTDTVVTDTVVTDTVVTDSVVTDSVVTDTVVTDSVVTQEVEQPMMPSTDTNEILSDKTKKPRKVVNKKLPSTVKPETTVINTEVSESIVKMDGEKTVKKTKKQLKPKTDDTKPTTDETKTKQTKKNKELKETKASKKLKKSTVDKTPSESKEDTHVEEDDFKARSFKVKLPDDTDYKGRFTGLTPYQAANKALSKYFRNQENVNLTENNHILFSIKESTRGTIKKVYNYQGCRIKLETAISYTIKSADGTERVITKQYKNQLIKIKKNPSINNNLTDTTITTEPVIALA